MDQFFTIRSNPIHERSIHIHIHIHEAWTISIHIQSSSISTIFYFSRCAYLPTFEALEAYS